MDKKITINSFSKYRLDRAMQEYKMKKLELKEYKSYINHVRECDGYVFKEFREHYKFENEVKWLKYLEVKESFVPEIVRTINDNTIITKKIEAYPIKDDSAQDHLYNIGILLAKLHNIDIIRVNCEWKEMLSKEYIELQNYAKNVMEQEIFFKTKKYLDNKLEELEFSNVAIIHRDLRPENVLTNNEKYYLLDFESMCVGDIDYDFVRMFNVFRQKSDIYQYQDFENFLDGYKSVREIKEINIEKWKFYSKYYAFRIYTRILIGKIDRVDDFENYIKGVLNDKEDIIATWIVKYNEKLMYERCKNERR